MTDATLPDELLHADDVARILGVSKRQVYRLMEDGEIEVIRVRKSTRVTKEALAAYIKSCTAPARPKRQGSAA